MNEATPQLGYWPFLRRATAVIVIAAGVIVVGLIAWYAIDALFLLFAGLLFGVFLHGLSGAISRRIHVPYRWVLSAVLLAMVAVTVAFLIYLVPTVSEQAAQLRKELTTAADSLLQNLRQNPVLGGMMPEKLQPRQMLTNVFGSGQGFSFARQVFSSLTTFIVFVVVILFTGVYFAYEPDLYRRGVTRLAPPSRRSRVREVLSDLNDTLWWYIMGRLISMAIIGVLAGIGLSLFGIPLAISLAVLTALLEFIPYVGPILAAIPPLLLALQQSPQMALYVLIFYLALQFAESYLVTPLIQRAEVHLPPVITIGSLVAMGMLAGPLGLLLAAPLAAAIMVLVKDVYVEDILEDRATPS